MPIKIGDLDAWHQVSSPNQLALRVPQYPNPSPTLSLTLNPYPWSSGPGQEGCLPINRGRLPRLSLGQLMAP